jgi:hypothetical protein
MAASSIADSYNQGVLIGGLGFHVGEIIDMYGHAEVEIAFQAGRPFHIS